jgi:hypothetical protein
MACMKWNRVQSERRIRQNGWERASETYSQHKKKGPAVSAASEAFHAHREKLLRLEAAPIVVTRDPLDEALLSASPAMSFRFHGALEELKDRLLPLDLEGEWQQQPNGVWKFRCRDGTGLLWSSTRGTIWFDGPTALRMFLKNKIELVLSEGAVASSPAADSTILVVHGTGP